MSVLAVLLVLAPLLAAAIEFVGRSTRVRSGSVAVVGASSALVASVALAVWVAWFGPLTIGVGSASVLRVDTLGTLVSVVVSLIGLNVFAYAKRQLDEPERSRLASAGSVALASTLLTATAGRLSVLTLAWVATTFAVVSLVHRGDVKARRVASRRVLLIDGTGAGAAVIAIALTVWEIGDRAFTDLSAATAELGSRTLPGFFGVSVGDLVGVLLVVAALARAAQLPFRSWIVSTLAAPTPTSALLHAGVVNGGAILLLRAAPLVTSPIAAWILAVAAVSTVIVWSAVAATRRDVKGVLASSTSAQMGFMLLAVAVGAPAAAIAHLMGHALYKSARFLGVGDAIAAEVRRRRATRSAAGRTPAAFGVLAALIVVAMSSALLHDADAWMTASSLAITVGLGVWMLGRRATSRSELLRLSALCVGAALGYLMVAAGLERALGTSVPGVPTAVPPPLALAVLGVGLVALRVCLSSPSLSARVRGVLSGTGGPRVPALARRSTKGLPAEPLSMPSSAGVTP
ncbi:MAG: proton-conducting transporter membrane subunit [Acidimicrobiales bacterium]|nr:proton-conducting transporter membrane subunit [Acidimicrobiales bacterium]